MTEKRKTATQALKTSSKIEDFIANGSAKPRRKRKVRRRRQKNPHPPTTTPSLDRIMSKATIQKTIRFSPNLIAQVETWQAEQLETGKQPMSFQQIQQLALEEWIRKRNDEQDIPAD